MKRWRKPGRMDAHTEGAVRVFREHLNLSQERGRVVVPCPFHADGLTRSFSVDLDQGLFFCFGACDEPKGGNAIGFLVKWAWVKDGIRLTPREARQKLTITHTFVSAQEYQRRLKEADTRLFLSVARAWATDAYREAESVAQRLGEGDWPDEATMTEDDWDTLADLYTTRSDAEYVAHVAVDPFREIGPEQQALYESARASHLWTPTIAERAERALDALTAEMETTACPAPPSETSTSAPSPPIPRPRSPRTSRPIPPRSTYQRTGPPPPIPPRTTYRLPTRPPGTGTTTPTPRSSPDGG